MRKFLSILMLACLLCGLALPAGAEGKVAKLYAKYTDLNDETWFDALAITQNIAVSFCFSTEEDGIPITGVITSSDPSLVISKTDTEGVFSLIGSTPTGLERFSLTYSDGTDTYAIPVAVTPASAPSATSLEIPSDKLNLLAGDSNSFVDYLKENDYSGSGDFTIILPPENLGSITCNVQLPGDATLTIKGASGKTVTDVTIGAKNICLDGITFTGSPAVIVSDAFGGTVSNCTFPSGTDKFAFKLLQSNADSLFGLNLSDNTFPSKTCNVSVSEDEKLIGVWQSTLSSTKPESIDIFYNVIPDDPATTNIELSFFEDMTKYASKGWTYSFNLSCDYKNALVAYDNVQVSESKYTLNTEKKILSIKTPQSGGYVVANLAPPKSVKVDATTKTVTVDADQAKLINKATVSCDFKAVKVTDSKGNPVAWNLGSDETLTFSLSGNSPYTIKDVSTTTVTKASTTTTSRSYNYKYQDYYLITPQRVTDCMRYAKDNLVTIECKEAGRRSISLPVASMAAAAEKGYSILLKNEKIANITMDPAALKSMAQQAKGTTVLLHYRSLNHKTLTTVGLASVQSHLDQFPNDNADLAFLLTATSDSETIEDLQLGTITLKIPFIVLPGTEEMKNEVYALQSETAASARETTVADGHLTTRLTDLTEHMVFQIGEPVETTGETTEPTVETTVETTQPETQPETVPETTAAPEPEEEEKGFPIWIPIVAVLLLGGGGAAAWFLYFRKRFKK